jgi:hypothetical protein
MANERLYRESIRFDLAEPEAFANRNAPTIAELNNAVLVENVTCALWEDDTEFTLGDPDTDDGLTFCSAAGEQSPTFDNATVVFGALRDKDRNANGVMGRAFDRLAFADREYIAILRVGLDSDVAHVTGEKIRMVSVKTDKPVDSVGSGENTRIVQNFLQNDWVNWNYKVGA